MLYGAHILGLSELSLDKSWCFLFIYKVGTFPPLIQRIHYIHKYTERLGNRTIDWIQWGHKKKAMRSRWDVFVWHFPHSSFRQHSLNALFSISWHKNQCNKIVLPIQRQSDSSAIFTNSFKNEQSVVHPLFIPSVSPSYPHASKMLKNHLITRSISSMHPVISVDIFGYFFFFSPCSKSFRSLVK